jgi:hypothetical protein
MRDLGVRIRNLLISARNNFDKSKHFLLAFLNLFLKGRNLSRNQKLSILARSHIRVTSGEFIFPGDNLRGLPLLLDFPAFCFPKRGLKFGHRGSILAQKPLMNLGQRLDFVVNMENLQFKL